MKSYFLLALILSALWTILWKGMALWKAAKREDRVWFIVLLILNTLGILDILYIYIFSRRDKQAKAAISKISQ